MCQHSEDKMAFLLLNIELSRLFFPLWVNNISLKYTTDDFSSAGLTEWFWFILLEIRVLYESSEAAWLLLCHTCSTTEKCSYARIFQVQCEKQGRTWVQIKGKVILQFMLRVSYPQLHTVVYSVLFFFFYETSMGVLHLEHLQSKHYLCCEDQRGETFLKCDPLQYNWQCSLFNCDSQPWA